MVLMTIRGNGAKYLYSTNFTCNMFLARVNRTRVVLRKLRPSLLALRLVLRFDLLRLYQHVQNGGPSSRRPKDGRDEVEASRCWRRADMALLDRGTSKGVASDHGRQVLSRSAYCTWSSSPDRSYLTARRNNPLFLKQRRPSNPPRMVSNSSPNCNSLLAIGAASTAVPCSCSQVSSSPGMSPRRPSPRPTRSKSRTTSTRANIQKMEDGAYTLKETALSLALP